MSDDESDSDLKQQPLDAGLRKEVPLAAQIPVLCAVVVFGCANMVTRQMAVKALENYSYVLGTVSALAYVVFYWLILGASIASGNAADYRTQLSWVWCGWEQMFSRSYRPMLKLFALAAAGDAIGDVLGFICAPEVSGPVHSLLAQFTSVFTAILSFSLLGKRYSVYQVGALVTVISATCMGVLPNLRDEKNGSNPVKAAVIAFSCIFNAFAMVTKEFAFGSYTEWAKETDVRLDQSLNIFVANTAESTLQLPFTMMLLPVAQIFHKTRGQPLFEYFGEALGCLSSFDECNNALLFTGLYIFFNLSWNISMLLSVKLNGAMATLVALKLMMPLSTVLFACVSWPLLGTTNVRPITWFSLAIIFPGVVLFVLSSKWQAENAKRGEATCCHPLKLHATSSAVGRS